MTDLEIKNKIQSLVDEKYKGSIRHLKPKLLKHLLGVDSYNRIYQILDPKLHQPYSLAIFCFLNDIVTQPICHCGNDVKFNTSTKKFMKYCSTVCKWKNNNDIQNIKKNTCLIKYGNVNILASEYGKNKIKTTNILKYGVDNYTKTEDYKTKVRGKRRSNESCQKISKNHLRRYYDSMKEKFPNVEALFDLDDYNGVSGYKKYQWKCLTCHEIFHDSISFQSPPTCKKCKPIGSKHELMLRDFLKSLNIEFEYNWRKLPSKKELDIYIPSKNIGIEICGLYWHSTSRGCGEYYHLNKLNECTDENINLITIFDDEIYNKKDIVLNRIKSKLGLINRKIYARKCEVREIDSKTSKKFLDKYHIQGSINGSYRYGLFYKNRLVSVMTFNKGRLSTGNKNKTGVYELGRYATIANFSVIGGAGKLFKHFIKTENPQKIFSYCDKRWNSGHVYSNIGMNYVKDTKPNYHYTYDCKSRLHRFLFQKNKLKHMENYSDNLTEREIMSLEGYHRIYDCGSKLFVWNSKTIE